MLLDFNHKMGLYVLRIPHRDAEKYRLEYGLDVSRRHLHESEAVLFTNDPYAALSFYHVGTPEVCAKLEPLYRELQASRADDCLRHFDMPEDQELWGFQKADVEYALARPNALIADEPGLGKTMASIVISNEIQARRNLVVCPASLRLQWEDKIRKWSTNGGGVGNGLICPVFSATMGIHPDAEWSIISWDLVHRPPLWRALAKLRFDHLILDEAHFAKTSDAARTKAIFGGHGKMTWAGGETVEPLIRCAERTTALTGTPLPNRPGEAFTLAHGLCPESIGWMTEHAFLERYNPRVVGKTESGKTYVDERVGRTHELQNRLRANFMTRHLKREVMTQLKMPVYDLIRVEETRAIKQALKLERLLDIDPETLSGADADVLGHIAEARRVMGEALAPQVARYIRMLIEVVGEEKLVVFAWHHSVLDILQRDLQDLGLVRVDGTDSPGKKHAKTQRFIKEPAVRLIIGNIISLGTGTDGLQEVCAHGLIAEPDWVPGNNIQCFDRLDRGGQREQVQGDIFVAPNSLAEKVLAAALRKGKVIHRALDEKAA